MSSPAASAALLRRQLLDMQNDKSSSISVGLVGDNIYKWQFLIIVPEDIKYYGGGSFKGRINFPEGYPIYPPEVQFETPIWHPNIYQNGKVCISILHPPGEDEFEYEKANERWLPIHTPESILLSIISILEHPNFESPANLECAIHWKDSFVEWRRQARGWTEASKNLL